MIFLSRYYNFSFGVVIYDDSFGVYHRYGSTNLTFCCMHSTDQPTKHSDQRNWLHE